jgi:hypothetical protein
MWNGSDGRLQVDRIANFEPMLDLAALIHQLHLPFGGFEDKDKIPSGDGSRMVVPQPARKDFTD